jgi:hypothetical protein
MIERTPRRFVAELGEDVDAELVAEAIAIERECCPFFVLTWEPAQRRLTVAVSSGNAVEDLRGRNQRKPTESRSPGRWS